MHYRVDGIIFLSFQEVFSSPSSAEIEFEDFEESEESSRNDKYWISLRLASSNAQKRNEFSVV